VSLVQRARIEAYVPLKLDPLYEDAVEWLVLDFCYCFGGCTILNDASGYYLDLHGRILPDRVSIVYTDTPLSLPSQRRLVESYVAGLAGFLQSKLYREEAILITALSILHHE
jgi:hypothetical protein